MTSKYELARRVSEKCGAKVSFVERIIDLFLEAISEALENEEEIHIHGFFHMEVVDVEGRKRKRRWQKRVDVRIGETLKDAINKVNQ